MKCAASLCRREVGVEPGILQGKLLVWGNGVKLAVKVRSLNGSLKEDKKVTQVQLNKRCRTQTTCSD